MTLEEKKVQSRRACRARFSLPSKDGRSLVQFECTLSVAHVSDCMAVHRERGRVRLRNGKLYTYKVEWTELTEREVWREETDQTGLSDEAKKRIAESFDEVRKVIQAPPCFVCGGLGKVHGDNEDDEKVDCEACGGSGTL